MASQQDNTSGITSAVARIAQDIVRSASSHSASLDDLVLVGDTIRGMTAARVTHELSQLVPVDLLARGVGLELELPAIWLSDGPGEFPWVPLSEISAAQRAGGSEHAAFRRQVLGLEDGDLSAIVRIERCLSAAAQLRLMPVAANAQLFVEDDGMLIPKLKPKRKPGGSGRMM